MSSSKSDCYVFATGCYGAKTVLRRIFASNNSNYGLKYRETAILAPRFIVSLGIKPLKLHRLVSFIVYLISLGLLLPVASLIVRRLHDSDKNGWLSLIVLIPTLGLALTPVIYAITMKPIDAAVSLMAALLTPALAAIIVLCSLKGSEGPNGYGADPNVLTEQ